MTEYGVRRVGFLRPTKVEILAQLRADARDETHGFGPNVDLRAHSPVGRWIAVLTERIDELWQDLEDLYYSAFIPTATGLSLSLKTAEMGIERCGPTKATGIATFFGDQGIVVPAGLRVQATNGALFVTTEQVTLPARKQIDVALEALEAGEDGNVAANTITTIVDYLPGLDSVSNEYDPGTTLILGVNIAGSFAITNDGERNDYQLIDLDSLLHLHSLDELAVTVCNDVEPTPFEALFHAHLEVIDDATGELVGRTETQSFSLAVGEQKTLTFASQNIDLHEISGDNIRVALVNEQTSEAILGLCYDSNNQYQSGAFYLNASEQSDCDAVLSLVSRTAGAISGGSAGESDAALRLRYQKTAATFGSGTAEAVLSQVYRVEGVLSASVRQNRMDYVVDGMNPHSLELTTYGGDPDDIAEALFWSAPAGCELLGTSAVTVRDSVGQAHVINFNLASRVNIYLVVTLSVSGSFSHVLGLTQVQDALVEYIGGVDSAGTFHIGLAPGEDVISQKIAALAMTIDGVLDVTVKLGTSPSPTESANIAIGITQIAETKGSYLTVTTT